MDEMLGRGLGKAMGAKPYTWGMCWNWGAGTSTVAEFGGVTRALENVEVVDEDAGASDMVVDDEVAVGADDEVGGTAATDDADCIEIPDCGDVGLPDVVVVAG